MNIIRDRQGHAEAGRADGAGGGAAVARRSVLGGLAALPVVYGIGAPAPAMAATVPPPSSTAQTADVLVRGVEQHYNLPLLTPGTRLVLPTGIKAVAIQDYYRAPHLASAETSWPRMTAADGSTVDASIIPNGPAPTRVAMLSGFRAGQGWYELVLPGKAAARRVTWDAARFPFLFIHGEFGAAPEAPFNRLFTLAFQPFSGNPYARTPYARITPAR